MPAVARHLLPNVRVVDGVSYPSTRAGLAAAIADLPPAGGCVVLPPNCPLQFECAEPVLIRSDNVTLIGHPTSVINGPAEGDGFMIGSYGVEGEPQRLRLDARRGDTSVALEAPLELEVGDTIVIRDLRDLHTHVSVVTDVTSPLAPQLADPLSDPFRRGESEACKLTMRKNLRVQLWLDGTGCSGSVTGFGAHHAQYGRFDITATNFRSRNSTGAHDHLGYGNVWQGVFENCGNANNALGYSTLALWISHCTRVTVRDVQITNSKGFGFGASFTNHSLFDNVTTAYTAGHGIKIGGSTPGSQCADCRLSNCAVSYVGVEAGHGQSESGLAYCSGSHDIVETNCLILNCSWVGWEVSNHGEHRIFSSNLYARNNGLLHPGPSIITFETAYGLVFNGAVYDTRQDGAIGTLWDGAFSSVERTRAQSREEATLYRKTVAAHTLGQDHGLRFFLSGRFSNATRADQTFIVKLKFGGTTLISKASPPIPPASNYRPLAIDVRLENAGAPDAQFATMTVRLGQPSRGGLGEGDLGARNLVDATLFQAACGVDTTVHQDFEVTLTLSDTDVNLFFQPDHRELVFVP
jgi:hypothetical protein